ncbi:MAG: leucine-rich repeat domain-containing protein [Opitutae bacterium]|nr:leucine-rich repeat domain-containing protein [Opitutae bacterium]
MSNTVTIRLEPPELTLQRHAPKASGSVICFEIGCPIMKTSSFRLIALCVLSFCLTANASDYQWGIGNNGAILSQYTGSAEQVNIPPVAMDQPVVRIGSRAFADQVNLKDITIPDSVGQIDEEAFSYCTGLTNVFIGRGTTNIRTWVFRGCHELQHIQVAPGNPAFADQNGVLYSKNKAHLVLYPPGRTNSSYTVPAGVLEIGNEAFGMSRNLRSVQLPEGLIHIGNYAFERSRLTAIAFPSSILRLGEGAFSGCSKLSSCLLTNGLHFIGKRAFEQTGLKQIQIPEGVERLDDWTFFGCVRLTDITLPDSLTHIQRRVFMGNTALSQLRIPANVSFLGERAFADCHSLTGLYFKGDAPVTEEAPFESSLQITIFHLPETKGWSRTWNNRPTTEWDPTALTNTFRTFFTPKLQQ